MSRDHYETTDDKWNEREVYRRLSELWKCKILALPVSYHVDACALREGLVQSWIEVKCRKGGADLYATYFIAALKFDAGVRISQTTGLPFILVFSWDGEIRYHVVDLALNEYAIRWGGRTKQTRDFADVEPMVHIPREKFAAL